MILTHTKRQAAETMLERSVRLYLHDADYLSALLLAGSVETMLIELLSEPGATGGALALGPRSELATAAARLQGQGSSSVDRVRKASRLSFDWLRHSRDPEVRGDLAFDAAEDAGWAIERAMEAFRRCWTNYPSSAVEWDAARQGAHDPAESDIRGDVQRTDNPQG